MQYKCENCKNVYYDHFCSYEARCCYIHGCIDCNPDSYLNTLKGKKCPDFIDKKKYISQKMHEEKMHEEKMHEDQLIVLPSFDNTKFLF